MKVFAARFFLLDRRLSSRWLSLLQLALPSCSSSTDERSLDWPGYLTSTGKPPNIHGGFVPASSPLHKLRPTLYPGAGVWGPDSISLISSSGCGLRVPDLPRIPMNPISPTGRAFSAIQRFWCHTLQGKSNASVIFQYRALIASLQ